MTALLHSGGSLHGPWTAWVWTPGIVLPLAAAVMFYARGLQLLWDEHVGRGIRVWEAACFAVGVLVVALALLSPVHAISEELFAAHMLQHELLMVVAAPLLVLGRPLVPSLWAFPSPTRRRIGALARHRGLRALWTGLTQPMVAFTVHGAMIWLWHAPALFQATLSSAFIHAAQHASFLLSALLFWWTIVQARAPGGRSRSSGYGLAVLLLFATTLHTGALGALLTFSRTLWYPRYGAAPMRWGLTAFEDQQLGGLLMWIPASVGYLVAALVLFAGWLAESERRVLDAERTRATVRAAAGRDWL